MDLGFLSISFGERTRREGLRSVLLVSEENRFGCLRVDCAPWSHLVFSHAMTYDVEERNTAVFRQRDLALFFFLKTKQTNKQRNEEKRG